MEAFERPPSDGLGGKRDWPWAMEIATKVSIRSGALLREPDLIVETEGQMLPRVNPDERKLRSPR